MSCSIECLQINISNTANFDVELRQSSFNMDYTCTLIKMGLTKICFKRRIGSQKFNKKVEHYSSCMITQIE
jgi:hypothetical protein